MTKRILSIVTMTAALALYTPFFVTASAAEMTTRIPFNFVVSGSTMPLGSTPVEPQRLLDRAARPRPSP